MDYDKILNDTLLAIKSMPTEKFEEICIRHGYTPTRKATFTEKKLVDVSRSENTSHKILLSTPEDAANDDLFGINDGNFADAA